jgi:hypothetical protein
MNDCDRLSHTTQMRKALPNPKSKIQNGIIYFRHASA